MRWVEPADVRAWIESRPTFGDEGVGLGATRPDAEFLEELFGYPPHLRFAIDRRVAETHRPVPRDAFDSIPFYSLARGLFLPLSGLTPDRAALLFGLAVEPPPAAAAREALLERFLAKDLGLPLEDKIACVLGDPFHGRTSSFKRDSLVALYQSMHMARRRDILDRLTVVGDPAALFAETRPVRRLDPPLTAREVLETLRGLPSARRGQKFELLRSLLARTSRLEAYFLVKLILRKAGFGFDYQGALVARAIAQRFGADEGQVAQAIALTDAFHVAGVLEREGEAGLKKIQLQPLVPVRPALASGGIDEIAKYPVFVERKYDGVRLLLHKATDPRGGVLAGAYTRNRGDWLELVPGLDQTIRALPARNFIVDGELHGALPSPEGLRPATVYELHSVLMGERALPLRLRYAAFDLLYLNGRDLTPLPLSTRREHLSRLVGPLSGAPLPVPLSLSEGQLAERAEDVKRLYQHFRNQGYEGVITKDLDGPYRLATRDPTWTKKKPEITLDVVLLAAVLSVTTKERVGLFGSYAIGLRTPEGGFRDIGDVAGVDRERDREIQATIMREGLLTGRRVERPSASGVRPGMELRPFLVATVKFEGVTKDQATGALSLRDPKIAVLRSDKSAAEVDLVDELEALHLRQRVG